MTEITQADLIAASALIHLNIIQPKDERVVAEYFAIHRKFGYGKGRMEERAAIVAWLRGFATNKTDELANILEAGEHLK